MVVFSLTGLSRITSFSALYLVRLQKGDNRGCSPIADPVEIEREIANPFTRHP
jgi:hypothetical protein